MASSRGEIFRSTEWVWGSVRLYLNKHLCGLLCLRCLKELCKLKSRTDIPLSSVDNGDEHGYVFFTQAIKWIQVANAKMFSILEGCPSFLKQHTCLIYKSWQKNVLLSVIRIRPSREGRTAIDTLLCFINPC